MASVWVARLTGKHGFEKLVAIKTILPEFAADDRFRTMFLDEARIASRIHHTHVTQILDLGEQHEILYLVMEYVDGDSLSRLYRALGRKNAPLPPNILLRIVADACGGLHAAHELEGSDGKPLEIVHRDVSPQNILISTLGVSKIIDFGIAKARDRVGTDTHSGLLKGKVNYMAPEQALGGEVDRRTDVFGMGALLYHLLAGKPPFEGDNQLATLHKLTSNQAFSPLPRSVPLPVAAVVRRALARKPEERFATAAALQAAIETAMTQTGLSCSAAEVGSFVRLHMVERTTKRKEAIDLALAAASERQRMRSLLRPPMSDASMVASLAETKPSSSEAMTAISLDQLRALQAAARVSSPDLTSKSGVSGVIPAGGSEMPLEMEASPAKTRAGLMLGVLAAIVCFIGVIAILAVTHRGGAVAAASQPKTTHPVASSPVENVAPIPTLTTVNIDDLPEAIASSEPAANNVPRVWVAPKPTASQAASAEPAANKRHRVNDGF